MKADRWYPTVVTLASGQIMVVGGSNGGVTFNSPQNNSASLEILPKSSSAPMQPLQFLWDTLPNNLYPLTYVLPSGRIFVFAGDRSTLLDNTNNYKELGISQITTSNASVCLQDFSKNSTSKLIQMSPCVDMSQLQNMTSLDAASKLNIIPMSYSYTQAFVISIISSSSSNIVHIMSLSSQSCLSAPPEKQDIQVCVCICPNQ
jgi:hypothetical protein